jgi:hypothetical protein
MKYLASIIVLLGSLLVILIAVVSFFSKELRGVWTIEFSSLPGFLAIAAVLAVMLAVLALVSFSANARLLSLVILGASFAGIVVGSTYTDIAMLFCICGGILLFAMPIKQNQKPADGENNTELSEIKSDRDMINE